MVCYNESSHYKQPLHKSEFPNRLTVGVALHSEQTVTAYDFLYWQCRIRQQSVRVGDGRPTRGMCPVASVAEDRPLGPVITLIVKKSTENTTAQFKHMVKKTHNPTERWEGAIGLFSGTYYQDPKDFSEALTALFGPGSKVCDSLLAEKKCALDFRQNRQGFRIPCEVIDLPVADTKYQFTYWHNSLFNPSIPGDCRVLSFLPDWQTARARKYPAPE